jgi:catechol 2,3-dioxygenase-like lactoylglutathione lyase family enzyme
MKLKNVIGLDHVVMLVRELDAAAESWRRLGFTLSPRGTHSPHLGSGNYTIMLGPDYIELLGILHPTPHNAPSRAFLESRGEGMERAAFTARDSAAGVEEIRALGFEGIGPIDFGRPVTLPRGGETEAKFRVFQWPVAEAPGGLRIFACQHLTPEAVWIPELQRHANTAQRIAHVEIVAREPRSAADQMARLIAGEVLGEADGSLRVASGSDRADFVFLDRPALERRYPGTPLDRIPEEGAAALVLVAADLEAAAGALGPTAIRGEGRVFVAPAQASGVVVAFKTG